MLNIPVHDIIQNNITEIWAVKDCKLCVLPWANQEANVWWHLFYCKILPIKNCLSRLCLVWYLGIYQQWKMLTSAHICVYYSNSVLLQRASFSHAGPHTSWNQNILFNGNINKSFPTSHKRWKVNAYGSSLVLLTVYCFFDSLCRSNS